VFPWPDFWDDIFAVGSLTLWIGIAGESAGARGFPCETFLVNHSL